MWILGFLTALNTGAFLYCTARGDDSGVIFLFALMGYGVALTCNRVFKRFRAEGFPLALTLFFLFLWSLMEEYETVWPMTTIDLFLGLAAIAGVTLLAGGIRLETLASARQDIAAAWNDTSRLSKVAYGFSCAIFAATAGVTVSIYVGWGMGETACAWALILVLPLGLVVGCLALIKSWRSSSPFLLPLGSIALCMLIAPAIGYKLGILITPASYVAAHRAEEARKRAEQSERDRKEAEARAYAELGKALIRGVGGLFRDDRSPEGKAGDSARQAQNQRDMQNRQDTEKACRRACESDFIGCAHGDGRSCTLRAACYSRCL